MFASSVAKFWYHSRLAITSDTISALQRLCAAFMVSASWADSCVIPVRLTPFSPVFWSQVGTAPVPHRARCSELVAIRVVTAILYSTALRGIHHLHPYRVFGTTFNTRVSTLEPELPNQLGPCVRPAQFTCKAARQRWSVSLAKCTRLTYRPRYSIDWLTSGCSKVQLKHMHPIMRCRA